MVVNAMGRRLERLEMKDGRNSYYMVGSYERKNLDV